MGRAIGRFDWWNIKDEHTAWEWAAQLAMYDVSPFGERRQDLRAGYHTAQIIAAQSMDMKQDEFAAMVEGLIDYLPCDQDQSDAVDFDALKRMKRSE